MNIIELHKSALIELCKKHHVKTLYVFGSALRNDFREDSDVDFSVLFDSFMLSDPINFGKNYWMFLANLENEFGRKIDLITEDSLKNKYFIRELNKTKQMLYAA